jgi:hypothetical protein
MLRGVGVIAESTRINRRDIWLDDDKFSGFIGRCINAGHNYVDVFFGVELFLEHNGTVVVEYIQDYDTLYYEVFSPGEWGPSEHASDSVLRMFNSVRPKDGMTEVFDIFTGLKLDRTRKEERFGEKLREAIAAQEKNAF